jgi:hypothetical protein
MSNGSPSERTRGEVINTWVQTVGICIAAAWGVYTFVYKEFTLPKSAPVNISLNLQLKKLESDSIKGDLNAIEAKLSATNPSSREVHLLPSAWIAYGIKIAPSDISPAEFAAKAALDLRDSAVRGIHKHVKRESTSVVAVGRLFGDTMLKPSETMTRTIVLYVPKSTYDLLDLTAHMPTAAEINGIQMEWTLNAAAEDLENVFYRINTKGERSKIPNKEAGSDKRLKLQWASANSQISLWPDVPNSTSVAERASPLR